jgi:hypothetical protein
MKQFLADYLPGKKDEPISDIPNLLDSILNNAREILPPKSFFIVDQYQQSILEQTHKLDCYVKAEAGQGDALACARGKAEKAWQEKLQKEREKNKAKLLKTKSRSIQFGRQRGLTRSVGNLSKTRLNQNQLTGNYQETRTQLDLKRSEFNKNFDPNNPNSTLGNKAILFDANGKVLRTASEISREGRAIDESAKLATDKKIRSLASKKRPKTEIKKLTDSIDKVKSTGNINSLGTLFAAVTGLIAIAALLAVLVPMSFLTVALNWLQTVTTMLANIKDVATTYLSVTEAGLSLFGYPKSTSKIKTYVNNIAYGIFGKDNYEQAKAAFAQGILNLTSMTKMLERIESARRGTNSLIDAVALSLGTANNSLKDAGLIPSDSPWMEYSKKIDTFVDAQTKTSKDPELKENIEKLTSEIQTQDEINKEIANEQKVKKDIKDQKDKELNNLKKLGEDVKPIINKQIENARE